MSIESRLNRFDAVMLIVSFIIGVGIFKTPAIVAEKAGTVEIFYAAWIIGGIISLCGALTFAEIGARLPVAGGYYKVFSYCYHPSFAFMFIWALVIINSGSSVVVALVGAEYIIPVLFPGCAPSYFDERWVALTILTILFAFNYAGIKMGAIVQNILSVLKIGMILLLSMAVFGKGAVSTQIPVVHHTPLSATYALGVALISVFFTYGGYQNTLNLGADIKNPQRNIPIAIFIGMAIVLILYMLINFAYCRVLGFQNMNNTNQLASELAKHFFGDAGYKITSVIVFTSVLGFLNSAFMHNPRVYYAMSEDNILPPLFRKVNPKTQTQEFALSFFFGLSVLTLFFLKGIEKIVNYVMFIDSMAIVFAAISVFILRNKMKNTEYTGYKMKFYPFIPAIVILALFIVSLSVLLYDFYSALIGIGLFVLGYPLYRLLKRNG